MMHRPSHRALLAAGLGFFLIGCAERSNEIPSGAADPMPPNFIVILADDLGYDDVSPYWTPDDRPGYERIDTPNIERMAREGIRFTSFYAAAPVCTPARAALLTGSYPPRVGLSKLDQPQQPGAIPAKPRRWCRRHCYHQRVDCRSHRHLQSGYWFTRRAYCRHRQGR